VIRPFAVFFFLACVECFAAPSARADVIVLKNGKRITASQVIEENGHVSGETPAGRLSVPSSIVDHIERGGVVSSSGSAQATGLSITPPPALSDADYAEIARGAVHDGAIDRNFVARLDGAAAQDRNDDSGSRAAAAHQAAAQFELGRGNMDEAIAQYRRAISLAPASSSLELNLLLNIAYLHLRRSEYNAALDFLDHARRLAPDSADVAKLAGWADYGLNRVDQAVAEWKKSLRLRPDPTVQAALQKAQRDAETESNFREGESRHFTLRYSGGAAPGLARGVLRTLEVHFDSVSTELDFTPPDSIGVILYTGQAFADITRAPAWVGALNDGRIRVPVQGLSEVTPELSRVLKHELTHSFLQQKTRGRCPVWLQEGIAQWMEGRRSTDSAALLVAIYEQKAAIPLNALEGSWMNFPSDLATWAYRWTLGIVEYIINTHGMGDLERILDRIAAGSSSEEAVHSVVRLRYNELEQETAAFLKKTYVK
jgi:tetratricopeptide (TPR) repeat protein